MEESKPSISLCDSTLLIKGEYHVGDEGRTVLFDYVGRLITGSRIKKGKTEQMYLQTFNPPNNHREAVPNPNLVEILREYIC